MQKINPIIEQDYLDKEFYIDLKCKMQKSNLIVESNNLWDYMDEELYFSDNEVYKMYKFSDEYILKYLSKINIYYLISNQYLSENILNIILNDVNVDNYSISLICQKQKLSNKLITKYKYKLIFFWLKLNQHIDQEFIEKLELLK